MNDSDDRETGTASGGISKFLASFVARLARDFFQLLMAFLIGTGGGALVCWYYGLPLPLSILGGILVLGLAVALTTDSWLD